MKYLSILAIALLTLLTIGSVMSAMVIIFDEMSKPNLEWYNYISLIVGNIFMLYAMLLVGYFCVNYIKLKLEE
jgi:hypothetical protein